MNNQSSTSVFMQGGALGAGFCKDVHGREANYGNAAQVRRADLALVDAAMQLAASIGTLGKGIDELFGRLDSILTPEEQPKQERLKEDISGVVSPLTRRMRDMNGAVDVQKGKLAELLRRLEV
jgi:hypothetical protein